MKRANSGHSDSPRRANDRSACGDAEKRLVRRLPDHAGHGQAGQAGQALFDRDTHVLAAQLEQGPEPRRPEDGAVGLRVLAHQQRDRLDDERGERRRFAAGGTGPGAQALQAGGVDFRGHGHHGIRRPWPGSSPRRFSPRGWPATFRPPSSFFCSLSSAEAPHEGARRQGIILSIARSLGNWPVGSNRNGSRFRPFKQAGGRRRTRASSARPRTPVIAVTGQVGAEAAAV